MPVAPSKQQTIQQPTAHAAALSRGYDFLKRGFDLCGAVFGLLLLLLPMAVVALVVVIDSPGGPIFRQERLGRGGKPFLMYKFRSMVRDAEPNGPQWAEEHDHRCTKVGAFLRRTKIDELPQLYNILRGEMSFVGPRPERPYFYDRFQTYIPNFRERLAVKPGLTGLAQVNGGYYLPPEKKIVFDLDYISRRSVGLDLWCICKTVCLVLTGRTADGTAAHGCGTTDTEDEEAS